MHTFIGALLVAASIALLVAAEVLPIVLFSKEK